MTNDKAVSLLRALDDRTGQGQISWTESADEGAFLASFPNYSIIVRQREAQRRGEVQLTVEFDLLDKTGRVIDTIYPYRIEGEFYDADDTAQTIFLRARDIALGVDKAVDELLAVLAPKPNTNTSGFDDALEDEIPF
jgi:hypothetical protein